MIKIISFDLQGTLSDSSYSDEFWQELLPLMYSESKVISKEEAKKELQTKFASFGKYDSRYYSVKYWLDELNINSTGKKYNFNYIQRKLKHKPKVFQDMLELIKKLKNINNRVKIIIITSTTKEFINIELGKHKKLFYKIYSSLDNFNIPGKTPKLYAQIANELQVMPSEILHVGDDYLMDIENAKKAGLKIQFIDSSKLRNEAVIAIVNKLKMEGAIYK